MTLSRAPVLLGDGIPLIGKTASHIKLEDSKVTVYSNNFIQINDAA